MAQNPVIQTTELIKRYGTATAVANLTFTIKGGEIFGFLGPLERL